MSFISITSTYKTLIHKPNDKIMTILEYNKLIYNNKILKILRVLFIFQIIFFFA